MLTVAQFATAFAVGYVTGAVVTGVALITWAAWPWIRQRAESWRYVLEMAAP